VTTISTPAPPACEHLILEATGDLARLTLNRQEAHNALSIDAEVDALLEVLRPRTSRPSVR
jgi:hypothetical protein